MKHYLRLRYGMLALRNNKICGFGNCIQSWVTPKKKSQLADYSPAHTLIQIFFFYKKEKKKKKRILVLQTELKDAFLVSQNTAKYICVIFSGRCIFALILFFAEMS